MCIRDSYSPARDLAAFDGQLLILRADRDTVVPPGRADRLAEALPTPPRVAAFPEAGHNDIQQFPAYPEALGAFFR